MRILIIDGTYIEGNIDKKRILEAVERALINIDKVIMPRRQVIEINDHWWGIMPCLCPSKLFITKIVNIIPENRDRKLPTINSIVTVFNEKTGEPIAIIDGRVLTAYRTAALCTLVAKLWSENVDTISIIGTGYQAQHIIKFFKDFLRFNKVLIYNRSEDKLKKFANILKELDINYEICNNLEKAHDADIVIESTTSREPVVKGRHLKRGRWLVISIGVSGKEYATVEDDAIARADIVIVDNLESVLKEVSDLKNYEKHREKVFELSKVLKDKINLSMFNKVLFKSVGMAVLDLYTAEEIVKQSISMIDV